MRKETQSLWARIFKEIWQIQSLPAAVTIVVASLGVLGVLPFKFEQIVFILLGLLAINAFIERITYFRELREKIDSYARRKQFRSRLDEDFKDFNHYCEDAREVFISALSLGFVSVQQMFAFNDLLLKGCKFRLLIVDPKLPQDALQMIAEHDERYVTNRENFTNSLRQEILTTIDALKSLEALPNRSGSLEARSAKGMPVFTITMVNPTERHGKMRIELRPYRRNQGERPYFELRKDDSNDQFWYNFFFQHYYQKLWDESDKLLEVPASNAISMKPIISPNAI